MKSEKDIAREVVNYVREESGKHDSGHGWSHIERVVRLSTYIHSCESRGDRFIIELGALLHDIGDHKFAVHDGPYEVSRLLNSLGVSENTIHEVVMINENISFSKGRHTMPKSDELQIVQDADRLDAMGAIGIARAFNYGGFKGNEIYDPEIGLANSQGHVTTSSRSVSTVHHFYDKLLLLRDLMNTTTGRKLANERHEFMIRYLEQFFREWNTEME